MPSDREGCGLWRMIWPAEMLAARGHDVTVRFQPFKGLWQDTISGPRLMGIKPIPSGDVFVYQRPLRRDVVEQIGILQRAGKTVVVDIDDHFHGLPLRHPARSAWNPLTNPDRNWEWFAKACQMADLVTCSTPLLAEQYGSHGRCVVVRNYVPRHYFVERKEQEKGPWIGWVGKTDSHVDDLKVTGGGVASAIRATGARMRVVGIGQGVARQLGLDEEPLVRRREPLEGVPVKELPGEIAQFDVAVAPLRGSAFNAAKSWIKPLEAAACGVPCVMSPTPEYLKLAECGIGIVASTPTEWHDELVSLCSDPVRRFALGQAARAAAEELTMEAHVEQWWSAWEIAHANRMAA